MGETKKMYRTLGGNLEVKSPLGRPRNSWVDDIKTDLVEVGLGGVDWICVAQDRDKLRALLRSVMNLRLL
jgi:hypothetical protein